MLPLWSARHIDIVAAVPLLFVIDVVSSSRSARRIIAAVNPLLLSFRSY
jgi:hypothetical protein